MKQNSKKRIVPMLFALLVVLTLVSCCFLGSTFARYTSTGTGSATVQVAKWNIALNNSEMSTATTETNFNRLSPLDAEYNGAGLEFARKNVIGDVDNGNAPILVATIENQGEVDAELTISWSAPTFYDEEGDVYHFRSWTPWTQGAIEEVFSLQLYYGTGSTWDAAYGSNLIENGEELAYILQADGGSDIIYIYATVTWTSDTAYASGASADARDTWIGQNIASVGWDLTYTAVQDSKLPA